jgi:hypothetical protein
MFRTVVCATTVALALTGCVAHQWAPGPGAHMAFNQASGQCKLAAEGVPTDGFAFAQGSPQFVGAYMGATVLAGAIGSAVKQNRVYNACMEAQGFVPVDGVQQ